jgi:hypothetical protein
MEQMADGGIAGYADGGTVHMQVGGDATEEAIRAKGRELGLSDTAIEAAVQRQKAGLAGNVNTPAATASSPPTGRELYAGQEGLFDFISRGFRNLTRGDQPEETYDISQARKNELPVVQAQQQAARTGIQSIAPPSAEEFARTQPPAAAPAAPPPPPPPPPKPKATPKIPPNVAPPVAPPVASSFKEPPVTSYIPLGADVPGTPEQAQEKAGAFSILPTYIEGSKALLSSAKNRDERLRALQANAPNEEIGKKAEEYIQATRGELEAEKKDRGAQFLISAGLAMASGTSPRAMQNIAQGLQVGVKDAKEAMKDFKAAQKELARMESDLENARIAQKERRFDRMMSFEQSAAERDERRQQHTLDGLMAATGQDKNTTLSLYNEAQQRSNNWAILGANQQFTGNENRTGRLFTQGENAANRAFQATEGAKDRANRLAAASIDKEGDRIRQLGGGDLLAGYKALKEINKDKFDLATAYSHYLSTWKRDPMQQNDRPLNGAEFAAQMGSLYTTSKPPAGAQILPR